MPAEIQMPNLGLSIAEGTIEKWLKKEGDRVEKGEVIVVLMTEKVTVEIPAEVSGKLLKILHPAGAVVKVGETIALIGEEGEAASAPGTPAALSPTVSPGSSTRTPRFPGSENIPPGPQNRPGERGRYPGGGGPISRSKNRKERDLRFHRKQEAEG